MNVRFDDHVEIVEARPGEDGAYLLDSTKANEILNWVPEYKLEDIIEETVDWLTENLNELRKQPQQYIHQK